MLRPMREKAGLGSPPEPFFTNSSECINNVINVKVDYKRNELPNFLQKLKELIDEQERGVEKAVIGSGKCYLRPTYSHLEVPQSKWYGMSREQRRRHIKKFNDMSVSTSSRSGHSTLCLSTSQSFPSTSQSFPSTSPSFRSTSPSFRSTSPSFRSTSPSSDTSHSSVLSAKLSVLSGKLGLPNVAIDGIGQKAAEILQTEGAIASAPGQPAEARMVISRSGKRPHLVIPKKMGGMACDDDCPMYKSAKLCSHTVAAAEYNRQLDQFVASYGKVKKTPNLTKLAMAEMPKGR